MRRIILYVFLVVSVVCAGQANKTLQDSVFVKGDVIRMPGIFFHSCGPYYRNEEQQDSLKLVADFLKRNPNYLVEISGHSDTRGNEKMNRAITNSESKTIKNSLIRDFGIDSTRITNKGYGEFKPIFSNKNIQKEKTKEGKEELHAKNRRFEMKILEIK